MDADSKRRNRVEASTHLFHTLAVQGEQLAEHMETWRAVCGVIALHNAKPATQLQHQPCQPTSQTCRTGQTALEAGIGACAGPAVGVQGAKDSIREDSDQGSDHAAHASSMPDAELHGGGHPAVICFNLFALAAFSCAEKLKVPCVAASPYAIPYRWWVRAGCGLRRDILGFILSLPGSPCALAATLQSHSIYKLETRALPHAPLHRPTPCKTAHSHPLPPHLTPSHTTPLTPSTPMSHVSPTALQDGPQPSRGRSQLCSQPSTTHHQPAQTSRHWPHSDSSNNSSNTHARSSSIIIWWRRVKEMAVRAPLLNLLSPPPQIPLLPPSHGLRYRGNACR